MNGPDLYPDVALRLAEQAELMRIACVAAIRRAEAGQDVDELHIAYARAFVAMNPPRLEPLTDGARAKEAVTA